MESINCVAFSTANPLPPDPTDRPSITLPPLKLAVRPPSPLRLVGLGLAPGLAPGLGLVPVLLVVIAARDIRRAVGDDVPERGLLLLLLPVETVLRRLLLLLLLDVLGLLMKPRNAGNTPKREGEKGGKMGGEGK